MFIRVLARRLIEKSPEPLGEREHVIAETARSVYDDMLGETAGR